MQIPKPYCALAASTSLFLLFPAWAQAAEEPAINAANTAWMLTSAVLVLFMTLPGLALSYGGLVRTKNVLSILIQCFTITCVVSLLWVAFAYSLAFGDGAEEETEGLDVRMHNETGYNY